MVWAFLLLTFRSVVRPVKRLSALFAMLHATGDYSLRSLSGSRDEIGSLSREIDLLIAMVGEHTQALRSLAMTAPLTGLANRRHFDEAYLLVWRVCRRENRPVGVIMVDVDWFKLYNDKYGHQGGGLLPPAGGGTGQGGRPTPRRHPGSLRRRGIRPGAARRLCEVVAQANLPHAGSPLGRISISLGCASKLPDSDGGSAALMEAADQELYKAKAGGRNRASPAEAAT
jgi:GGDEF domain-containing protein